ncbi:MAG: FprA family A-type flavoprotein [Candidatus Altiarchaeota archaeon]|nr:FprA family A-type flavoprotein [Candidatus Altiarchaeota archaeon]
MGAKEIVTGVHWVGSLDPSRKYFDELIPLPHGTTYNSYLIRGSKKVALIDGVDPSKTDILFKNLDEIGIKTLDFIVSQHAEQDHSGAIPALLEKFPMAKVVTHSMAKTMLQDLLNIPDEKIQLIKNGDELSLGNKTLKFILTPWVHWPETMFTLLKEDNILFTCDLYGSHLATENIISKNDKIIEDEAKRYYAEIMMPFVPFVKKHTTMVRELKPKIIATSHGPVYKNPEFILDLYEEWTSGKMKKKVLIAWVSMHESTKKMAAYLENALKERGIEVISHNMTGIDSGVLAMDLIDSASLVLASPVFLGAPHPNAINVAVLINLLKPKTKFLAVIGSFGWAGKLAENFSELLPNLKAERLEPVMVKGVPKEIDFERLDKLAEIIVEKHSEL